MYFSSLYIKLLFILTLYNSFLSLLIGDSDIIEDNFIDIISLNSSNSVKINLKLENNDVIYLSLISLNNSNFNINSNINFFDNITNSISKELNKSMIEDDDKPFINISSNVDNTIQIIHIKKNSYSSYRNVTEGDDETIKIDKKYYNFVKFLDDDKKIQVEIKFKDNLENNIYFGIVRLLSPDIKYIPRVESFNKTGLISDFESKKVKKKDKICEIKNIKYNEEDKKKGIYTAFVLSINTTAKIKHDYSIIINEDVMNTFLFGSIIVALIFAVITFFLIRRKQNVGEKKNEEEFLEEKQEEEKED